MKARSYFVCLPCFLLIISVFMVRIHHFFWCMIFDSCLLLSQNYESRQHHPPPPYVFLSVESNGRTRIVLAGKEVCHRITQSSLYAKGPPMDLTMWTIRRYIQTLTNSCCIIFVCTVSWVCTCILYSVYGTVVGDESRELSHLTSTCVQHACFPSLFCLQILC